VNEFPIFAGIMESMLLNMKKIHLMVVRSYIGPLILTFFIALFILLMQFLWKYVDELVGKGLEWYIIAELLFYASATFVPMALPLAILLSSLMTFGNFGEHYELVAMKSAGLSLRRIMAPLVILSFLISIGAFYFSNNILPRANLKFHSILYDVRKQRLALNIKEGVFYKGIDGFVIRVGEKEEDGKTLRNIMIYDHRNRQGNTSLTTAESGTMEITPDQKYLMFHLFDGHNYDEEVEGRKKQLSRPFRRTAFEEQSRRFDLSGFELNRTDENLFRSNYRMFNINQLTVARDSLRKELNDKRVDMRINLIRHLSHYASTDTIAVKQLSVREVDWDTMFLAHGEKDRWRYIETALSNARSAKERIRANRADHEWRNRNIRKHEVEYHRKFTLSFACLILFFIGAPLGAIIRKGGLGMPVVVSILLFVIFHVSSMTGERLSKEMVVPTWQGMWIASAIFLPLGVFLSIKATTDAPLMDADGWRKMFRRIERLWPFGKTALK
jgi:lipopolysaccharide export system permease protein